MFPSTMRPSSPFADLTLRDGHQSIAATRMTTGQMMRVLKMIHDAGFASLELWGGATLDTCVRFLDEDPWDRLVACRDALGSSAKVRCLLRGQNLFGYQPGADDLVISFVREAVRSGVGLMRIFDALNDFRNLQIPILATRAYGGKVEGALSYTTSPVHTTEYFVQFARQLQDEGVDQIAIKDMAGLLHPNAALDLFRSLRQSISVPITLHSHTTTGVGDLCAVMALHHKIDCIDTAITPFAGGTSHPPIEVMVVFAEEMGIDHGLDKALILRVQAELFKIYDELRSSIPQHGKYYRPIRYEDVDRKQVASIIELVAKENRPAIERAIPLMRGLMKNLGYPVAEERMFEAQVPGGMLSNLHNQLKEFEQLHLMDRVLDEIPKVRADAGYVPLVTPTSQIVGSQAVFNVMHGRYALVSEPFKMIFRGAFGRTPAPVNPEVAALVLEPGEKIQHFRAASYLTPVLEQEYKLPFVKTHKDLLLHLLFGQGAEPFLRKKNKA